MRRTDFGAIDVDVPVEGIRAADVELEDCGVGWTCLFSRMSWGAGVVPLLTRPVMPRSASGGIGIPRLP